MTPTLNRSVDEARRPGDDGEMQADPLLGHSKKRKRSARRKYESTVSFVEQEQKER